jgi:hypothetical protein
MLRLLFSFLFRSGLSGQHRPPFPLASSPPYSVPRPPLHPGGVASPSPPPPSSLPLPMSVVWSHWLQLQHLHSALLSQARTAKTTFEIVIFLTAFWSAYHCNRGAQEVLMILQLVQFNILTNNIVVWHFYCYYFHSRLDECKISRFFLY